MAINAYGMGERNQCIYAYMYEKKYYLINDLLKSTGCQSQFIDGLTHFLFWEILWTHPIYKWRWWRFNDAYTIHNARNTCLIQFRFHTFHSKLLLNYIFVHFIFLDKNLWCTLLYARNEHERIEGKKTGSIKFAIWFKCSPNWHSIFQALDTKEPR